MVLDTSDMILVIQGRRGTQHCPCSSVGVFKVWLTHVTRLADCLLHSLPLTSIIDSLPSNGPTQVPYSKEELQAIFDPVECGVGDARGCVASKA